MELAYEPPVGKERKGDVLSNSSPAGNQGPLLLIQIDK